MKRKKKLSYQEKGRNKRQKSTIWYLLTVQKLSEEQIIEKMGITEAIYKELMRT